MPRLAWLTDIHLDAVEAVRADRFVEEVSEAEPDAVLVGGDIAQAASWGDSLRELARHVAVPVYFVLGNHDYYDGSIAAVREEARRLSRESTDLTWLPDAGPVPLGRETILLGHGGWGDARIGNFAESTVVLNDYLLIDELARTISPSDDLTSIARNGGLPDSLRDRLQALGDDAADHFHTSLSNMPSDRSRLLVLTHVPPWREACWYEGNVSDDNWAPHFTCRAVGDVLREYMARHPEKTMTVLCGHTHSPGEAEILPNLHVSTGAAEYGEPELQRIIEIE